MKHILFLFLFFHMSLSASSFTEMAQKEFKAFLGSEINITFLKYSIPKKEKKKIEKIVKQRFYKPWLYAWKLEQEHKTYHAFIDNVMGKQYPITFMVIFDEKGSIIFSKILKYRNTKGHAVKSPDWLAQFLNKNSHSSFVLNQDIDGVSGATISSKSLTKGFHKLSLLVQNFLK